MAKQVYNRVFNEVDWALVNEENKEVMDDYLEELKQKKKSPETIKQYKNDLRIIFIYILKKQKNKSILELGRKDFRKISLWFDEECGMSNARINRLLSVTRSLLTYCEDDDEIEYDNNVAKKVAGLKKNPIRGVEDDSYFFLPFEVIYDIRNMLIEQGRLMDAVLLMVAYDSACRRKEVAQVTKGGTEGNYTNFVAGKGGKKFRLIFLDDTKELLEQWLKKRGEDNIEELFITSHGGETRPLAYESIYQKWKKWLSMYNDANGTEYDCPFHGLRHSRLQNLKDGEDFRVKDENGNNRKFSLDELKILAHHESVDTTSGYLKNQDAEVLMECFGFNK